MLTELFGSYLAAMSGQAIAAKPLQSAFRDYVAQELRVIESAEVQQYWSERLADLQDQSLYKGYSGEGDAGVDVQIETASLRIKRQTCEGLRKLASLAGAPLKSVLLAAHLRTIGCRGDRRPSRSRARRMASSLPCDARAEPNRVTQRRRTLVASRVGVRWTCVDS